MTAAAVLVGLATASAVWTTAARRSAVAAVRRRLPPAAPTRAARARGRAGLVGVGLGVAAVVAPVPAALVVVGMVLDARRRARARHRADADAAVATLPEVIDLLAVGARAGLPAPAAAGAVASRAPPPWGPALDAALERFRRGERFADALDDLVAGVGEAGHALRSVLRAAADDGSDLEAGLDRLAVDARDARRRRAEEAARRIPVRLLLPLVACSLPAFALLSIVPIVAGALGALDL